MTTVGVRVLSTVAAAIDRTVARERLLILAAHGDRIVPAEHPRWLEAHWNRPRTVWFSGSHLAPFGRPTIRAAIRRLLGELDVLPAG